MSTSAAPARMLCLHSSASSPRQWRRLVERMSGFAPLAAPLAGYDSDAPWTRRLGWSLDAEAERLLPLLDAGPLWLAGHSFGAAVALQLALRRPQRVLGLALYEPVRFAWLAQRPAAWTQVLEITGVAQRVGDAVATDRPLCAAAGFVDYWSGAGAFAALDPTRQQAVAARMSKVSDEFAAAFADTTPLAALRRLDLPVLLLGSAASPAPVREIVRRMAAMLPHVDARLDLPGGHMAPVTHAEAVNPLIERFVHDHEALAPAGA